MNDGQQHIAEHQRAQKLQSQRYQRKACLVQKKHDQLITQKQYQSQSEQAVNAAQQAAGTQTLPQPLPLFGTHILSAIGGHSGAHSFQRTGQEDGHLVGGGSGGDIHGAQNIHRALQHHAADGGDGELQTHGHAQRQQIPDAPPAPAPVTFVHLQHIEAPADLPQAAETGYKLADGSGKGRAEHAPVQIDNEKQVQTDVDDRGHHQPDDGGAAVTQRAQNARAHIVQDIAGDACKNGDDIGPGKVNDIGRRVHQLQNLPAENHRKSGDGHGKKQTAIGRAGDIFSQRIIVLGAKSLGDRDGHTAADADGAAHHQKVDGAGGAYGSQRIAAQKFAHDGGVHHVIQLLEQHTQQNRKAELHNQGQRTAFCKVFRHLGFTSEKN